MAKFKFLSESETEDKAITQYQLEVTVDLGDKDVRTYEQTVVFKTTEADEKAQEYADEMEQALLKQKEDGTLAPLEESAE